MAFASVEAVSGTTETDIFVTAQQATFNTAGTEPTSGSQAFLGITVYDIVTGGLFVEAFGCTPSPDFQIDQMLTTARLGSTSIPVFDSVPNTTSTAVVSADRTGVGDVTRSASAGVFHSGNFTVTTNFVGFFRNAQATLSLSDPALNVSFEGAATYAELDNVRNGAADVCVLSSCTAFGQARQLGVSRCAPALPGALLVIATVVAGYVHWLLERERASRKRT